MGRSPRAVILNDDDARAIAATAALRERLEAAAGSVGLDDDAHNLAAALGRVLAQAGASPTLAGTILEPLVLGSVAAVLRGALLEAYITAREERRAQDATLSWEMPGCAVALGGGRIAVCANPPHEDDAASAWADRTAASLVKRRVKEVVLSGEGSPRARLEESLLLVGIRFVSEAKEPPDGPGLRFRLPWSTE